jgi:hypothetical protein
VWDGWPDGDFERDFTFDELHDTNNLRVHWASKTNGGDRKGNEFSPSWEGGKRNTRKCLGIIQCDEESCRIIIRPRTSPKAITSQLSQRCECGAILHHIECTIISTLWSWKGGVHFKNGGFHSHPRPTHILHTLPNEQQHFEEIVKNNPNLGPLGLIVGVPGLNGPGESVADISDVYLNADRVSKDRQKIKHNAIDLQGDGFIDAYAKFEREYQGFIIREIFGNPTVISVQTDFMRSQFVKPHIPDEAVNGMASDAAHGWWDKNTSLLMVSSTYCPTLYCWVPGVLSYTNGASSEHFKHHFLAVFSSIALEASKKNIILKDSMFAGVRIFNFYNLFTLSYPIGRSWILVKLRDVVLSMHLLNSGKVNQEMTALWKN